MSATTRITKVIGHVSGGPVRADTCSAEGAAYKPPRVWKNEIQENRFSAMNRPTAGSRSERDLPIGEHPLQLHSLGTPNGQKVTILLEELNDAKGVEYDAWLVKIFAEDQFTSGFVSANPNSKIPALVDRSDPKKPIRVFESGAILLHIAEKYNMFLPKDSGLRAECFSWLMWQMGSAPLIGGGFGHFYAYAPDKLKYPIDRYSMEMKRLMDVADKHLMDKEYFCGSEYTIADMAIYPWMYVLCRGGYKSDNVGCNEFLEAHTYKNLHRWMDRMAARPAVKRGMKINVIGKIEERHSRGDVQ